MRGSILAACLAAAGLAAALGACGGPAATTHPASVTRASARAAVPRGYHRVGGVAQGMSLAVPDSWIVFDLARQNAAQALMSTILKLPGRTNSAIIGQLTQALPHWARVHAIYAVDIRSMTASPGHYATNISAFCNTSGTTQSGRAGLPFLRREAKSGLPSTGGHRLRLTDIPVGGIPGQQASVSPTSPAAGTVYFAQLAVLSQPGRICLVQLSAAGPLPGGVLAQVAPTVQYP